MFDIWDTDVNFVEPRLHFSGYFGDISQTITSSCLLTDMLVFPLTLRMCP